MTQGDRDNEKEGRADTDASLGTERAAADDIVARAVANAERQLDALITRDRVLAHMEMARSRQSADDLLACERSDLPEPSSQVLEERVAADDSKRVERSAVDAVMEQERRRAGRRRETRRKIGAQTSPRQEANRQRTDEHLSTERGEADSVAADRDASENALGKALSAEADRAEVFAMVTHDLRNPLSVILGYADMIEDGADISLAQEAAGEIKSAAARMGRLLTDLLDLVRIDRGTFRLDQRPYSVTALLSEMRQSYRPMFDGRRVTLSVDLPTGNVFACFDHDRIVQMLSNLLGNALKFTPVGGSVDLQVEHNADNVVFVVRDNGAGIEPNDLPHLFERFWQRDSDTRRGLGLGLYLCRTIARAHGGDISVQSEVGKGSTFRVWLPVSKR